MADLPEWIKEIEARQTLIEKLLPGQDAWRLLAVVKAAIRLRDERRIYDSHNVCYYGARLGECPCPWCVLDRALKGEG